MKNKRKKIHCAFMWCLLGVVCANLLYSIFFQGPTYRTFVENQITRLITIIYLSLFLFCIFYNGWLVRRIKVKRSHLQIKYSATRLYYLMIAGIPYFALKFFFDLGERIYFHHYSLDNISEIIGELTGVVLVVYFLCSYKHYLKYSRSEIEILKRASYEAFEDEEYDLSIEHVKELLKIDSESAYAYGRWGTALACKAKTSDESERDILYQDANNKFMLANDLAPDNSYTIHTWGFMLADQARHNDGEQADALFTQAYEKYDKSFTIKNDNFELLGNWGFALIMQAKKKDGEDYKLLLEAACRKFEQGYKLETENHQFYNLFNWGWALMKRATDEEGENRLALLNSALKVFQEGLVNEPDDVNALYYCGIGFMEVAKLYKGDQRKAFLEKAKGEFLKAEQIEKGKEAYNLACVSALLGEEEECRRWLRVGEEMGTLPSRAEAMEDEDLASVREKEWFGAIRWGEEEENKGK